jgi:D-serine deaminase-like pyridoxal phosphate-dependent protein
VALKPISIYTHEGQAYSTPWEQRMDCVEASHARLMQLREILGGQLPLWPGCSVTGEAFACKTGVGAVRPGAYVFGDLFLSDVTGACRRDDIALTVRSTVVDRPTPELALIDAGSKTFSGDHLPDGTRARKRWKRLERIKIERGTWICHRG